MTRRRRRFILFGGSSGPQVEAFAFQSETDALVAELASPPPAEQQRWMDRTIRRLKDTGLWTKCRWFQIMGATEEESLINWKTPSETTTKVGTPAHTAFQHWVGATGQNYLNTGLVANTLSQNNFSFFVWNQTGHMGPTTTQSGATMGCINASSQGISLVPNNSGAINARMASANVTSLGAVNGYGLCGCSRAAAGSFTSYSNGLARVTSATASVTLPNLSIYLCGLNNNGSITNGNTVPQSAWWFGQALTETEVRELTAIIGEYLETGRYGMYHFEEPGVGEATITADCIAYGLTGQSVCFAVEAARAGASVAIIGGWRDRFSFGMAGGGLGFTDFDTVELGGLPRWIITDMNTQEGVSDDHVANGIGVFKFTCKRFNRTMKSLLAQYDIPVYLSGGVDSVAKTGTTITSFHTADGRTATADQYFDGSYEMDLMRTAGVSYFKGREAAGSGIEANNGVEAITSTAVPLSGSGATVIVDPWTIPGDPDSGLLPGVHVISSAFTPAVHNYPATGTSDTKIPAYNFRLTLSSSNANMIPFPTSAPPGFDAANYELLLRQIDAAADAAQPLTIATLFKVDNLRNTGRYDFNNSGIFGTNLTGGTWDYPLGTYAEREVIWKAVWNNILGIWYVLQHYDDARINGSALRTEALTWGYTMDHYYSPHENDDIFAMPQMYIRESIRMIGSQIMNANNMDQTDGQVPTLGASTVSCASYQMDSHSVQRAAYESSAGVWETRGEGGMLENSGGANDVAPLPYVIFVPQSDEVTNLSVAFGCSTTHVSYGTTRMEFTAMQTGQSMGRAAALASAGDNVIQNVDYATLRTALLASAELSGEVDPVIPQTT